jgi:hypothetical protein
VDGSGLIESVLVRRWTKLREQRRLSTSLRRGDGWYSLELYPTGPESFVLHVAREAPCVWCCAVAVAGRRGCVIRLEKDDLQTPSMIEAVVDAFETIAGIADREEATAPSVRGRAAHSMKRRRPIQSDPSRIARRTRHPPRGAPPASD